MENHFYTIGGDIRLQSNGGAIGSDLTGECARLYMMQWDEKLKLKLRKLGIILDMYTRYVDDMILVMRAVGKGWKYDKDKNILIFDRELERSDTRTDTQRTADIVSQIADSIEKQIQVTIM